MITICWVTLAASLMKGFCNLQYEQSGDAAAGFLPLGADAQRTHRENVIVIECRDMWLEAACQRYV